jgi:hypothetical protein
MHASSEFELVCKVQGLETAEIIKGRLENEGIPVHMKYDVAGRMFGIICDGLGEVQLLVSQRFAKEAKRILSETNG